MVCAKCEKKLAKLATSDTYKDGSSKTLASSAVAVSASKKSGAGSSSSVSSSSSTGMSGGRKIGENKLLSKKRVTAKFNPYASAKCKTCKSRVHQDGAIYCQGCAYKAGLCAMCGTIMLDTSKYTMSAK